MRLIVFSEYQNGIIRITLDWQYIKSEVDKQYLNVSQNPKLLHTEIEHEIQTTVSDGITSSIVWMSSK